MSAIHPSSIDRRHDLDALRAVAMLLGIGLHGAISFIPFSGIFWAVQDTQTNGWFGVFFAALHGFRMPLFFLISGFFTAMLWRKRGLKSLMAHRFKRIFLPMMIGLFTIIPATWIVSGYVRSTDRATFGNESVEAAANSSSTSAAGSSGQTDIWTVTAWGDVDTLASLIEQGVDVNAKEDQRGSTALHGAVFFGRAAAAKMLLDAGANVDAIDNEGKRPSEFLHVSWGVTKYIADLIHVEVDEGEVRRGRKKIADLLGMSDDAQSAKAVGTNPGLDEENTKEGLVELLMGFPLWGHLWFLWFLCWLVVGFVICVKIGQLLGLRNLPIGITVSVWRYTWLLPLTAIPQFFMRQGIKDFGPDTSIGLLPMPAVFFYYTIFFAYGALYFDTDDQIGRVGRRWWLTLPIALLIILPMGLFPGSLGEAARLGLSVFSQVAYAWLVSFGMIGMFRTLLSAENKAIRYISDSSYWLYLAHVPLIIYVQYIVRDWSVSPWIKFMLVCFVTSFILLISYQLFVRHTPIGILLNGPRHGRSKPKEILETNALDVEP